MTILDKIVATKRAEVAAAKARVTEAELIRRLERSPPVRDFAAPFLRPTIQVIAEVKKASPSAGVIRADFDPVAIARVYEANGAACVSVLTDEQYFQGHLSYLESIRAAVGLPVLRKDFIIDPYQLLEARIAGADCVLLIAEILPGKQLNELAHEARELGMRTLVELYDAENVGRVLDSGTILVGINNRDLRSFEVRLEHTLELMKGIPNEFAVISESGIRTRDDVLRLQDAGVRGILVGESLMRSEDIGLTLRQLRGG